MSFAKWWAMPALLVIAVVNLTSKRVPAYCLTLSPRSPLAPLKKGGRIFLKSPFLRGLKAHRAYKKRGIETQVKAIFL
jgi:hypothetical protein